MTIEKLEHVTVLVRDLDESRQFYTEMIGLRDGPRPPFSFPGAWLYAGDTAVVHLVAGREIPSESTGAVDHFALAATDSDAIVARFKANQVTYEEREVPGLGLRQIFVDDPSGVCIELNFPSET